MELERRPERQLTPIDDGPTAVSTPASRVLDVLQRARNAEGEPRLKLAAQLNGLLKRPVHDAEREAFAQLIIEKLDDEAFHDLYDDKGGSCRAAAVEAVLSLGFPWALHVWPDDLEYLRAVRPVSTGSPTLRAMAVVTGVLAALFALAFFIHL
jgi:hypothetical protein